MPFPRRNLRDLHAPCAGALRSRARRGGPGQRRGALVRRAVRAPGSPARSACCACSRSATSRCSASFSSASARVFRNSSTKTADLRPQDVGVDRLAQVVDGAGAVAAQHVLVVDEVRRQEQDRDVAASARRCLISVRQLDAAHARHLDVEHDRREVVLQQRAAALRRRTARAPACSRIGSSITSSASRLRGSSSTIRIFGFSSGCIASRARQRYSQTRSSDSSWSVFTGLAM